MSDQPSLFNRLLREPLLRFLLLGGLLFALNAWLSPEPVDLEQITIPQARIDAWEKDFRSGNGRLPNAAERQRHMDQWVTDEVLYREALRLGLHGNDPIVRRQLIQKMGFIVDGIAPLETPDDATLQQWLDERTEQYGFPPTVSFEHVFISRGHHGAGMEKQAQALLKKLQAEPEAHIGLGDNFLAGQRQTKLPPKRLRQDFGKAFVEGIAELPEGKWQGPIASGYGLHLVRINQRQPLRAATLKEARKRVELDYRLYQQEQHRAEALAALREQYQVQLGNGSSKR